MKTNRTYTAIVQLLANQLLRPLISSKKALPTQLRKALLKGRGDAIQAQEKDPGSLRFGRDDKLGEKLFVFRSPELKNVSRETFWS